MPDTKKPEVEAPKAPEPAPKPKAAKSSGPWGEVQQIQAKGQTAAQATQIVASSAWTVVMVECKDGQGAGAKTLARKPEQGVILPAGAAIGDLVELHFSGYIGRVFTPKDESFTNKSTSVEIGSFAMFRKLTENGWRLVTAA